MSETGRYFRNGNSYLRGIFLGQMTDSSSRKTVSRIRRTVLHVWKQFWEYIAAKKGQRRRNAHECALSRRYRCNDRVAVILSARNFSAKTGCESADESGACISGADPSSRISYLDEPSPLHILCKVAAALTPILPQIISRRKDGGIAESSWKGSCFQT